jgi:hypothetical protein
MMVLLGGCRGKTEQDTPSPSRSTSKLDTARLGERVVTLRALAMPHHVIAKHLGAHRVSCRSTLKTHVPSFSERSVTQQLSMAVDAEGRFAATKNTDPQHGEEVVWTGSWLYPRLRHSKFVKRRPRDVREPRRVADRMYGLLPGYVELLGRFMTVKAAGDGKVGGRKVVKVTLGLAADPRPMTAEQAPSRRWRHSVVARKLKGTAALCAKTGVPLAVDLQAEWDFHPPAPGKVPASGVPARLDKKNVGRMALELRQRLSDVGGKVSVTPPDPSQVDQEVRRVRLELERQMLTGERPVAGRVDRSENREGDEGAE